MDNKRRERLMRMTACKFGTRGLYINGLRQFLENVPPTIGVPTHPGSKSGEGSNYLVYVYGEFINKRKLDINSL
jgi:hypothetical protein